MLESPIVTAPTRALVLDAPRVVNEPAAGVFPPTTPSIGPTNAVEVIEVAADTVPRLAMVVLANVLF